MNYLKSASMVWSLYALGYFIFWLYSIFEDWAWPTFISWLTLMIIAVVYDNGEIGVKKIGGGLFEIIFAIFALLFFPAIVFTDKLITIAKKNIIVVCKKITAILTFLVVFDGKLTQLIKNNKKIIIAIFKKIVAGVTLFMIFESFYWMIDRFWQLSPMSTLFFATACFILSGAILLVYIPLFAPAVAGWFTQKLKENSSPWLQISNQVVIAIHIGLLLPVYWLIDDY